MYADNLIVGVTSSSDFWEAKRFQRMLKPFCLLLSNQDSNLDWLIQSQMCYHYTNGHFFRLKIAFFTSQKRVQKYYYFSN